MECSSREGILSTGNSNHDNPTSRPPFNDPSSANRDDNSASFGDAADEVAQHLQRMRDAVARSLATWPAPTSDDRDFPTYRLPRQPAPAEPALKLYTLNWCHYTLGVQNGTINPAVTPEPWIHPADRERLSIFLEDLRPVPDSLDEASPYPIRPSPQRTRTRDRGYDR